MTHTTENSKEVLRDSIGFKVAMSFKPFINPKCSEHMEIVKDMAKAINSAIHSPDANGIVFNQGYKEGKKQGVNERQKLLDSNRELLEALTELHNMVQGANIEKTDRMYSSIITAQKAINNAKK